jgi:hypothetical protein
MKKFNQIDKVESEKNLLGILYHLTKILDDTNARINQKALPQPVPVSAKGRLKKKSPVSLPP